VLAEKAVEEFKTRLRGKLIRRGDEDYNEARIVFNAMIDRYPALIIRCAGVADVIDSVNFARDNNLLVAVRGGGHNVTGSAVCNDGIVIDLSQMKGMRVDPVARTIQTEPGLTWGELNHDLQVFELGASGGFVSITGIPGLTLGGGFGWVVRKHGLAMDNLLLVDIVTADGRFLTASSSQNSDLFWGVRGGGGNFGAHRDLTYNFLVTSEWADRADSERNIRWTRQFWEAVQPFLAKAVYVNYTSDEGDDVIKAAYAANVRERLVALKNKYDPTNLFRLNQNIKPTV